MSKRPNRSSAALLKQVLLFALPLILKWWRSRQGGSPPPRTVATGNKTVPGKAKRRPSSAPLPQPPRRRGPIGDRDTSHLPRRTAPPTHAKKPLLGGSPVVAQFRKKRSDVILTDRGTVVHLLPDDNEGSRHQRFLVDVAGGRDRNGRGGGITIKIAHNIDLAPRVPVSEGDTIKFKGEYEYNDLGGAVHWTHHDPKQWRDGGWIDHRGKRYE